MYLIYYRTRREIIECKLCGKEMVLRDIIMKVSLRGNLEKVHQSSKDGE
jgi:hypothetical protein